jgi:hypothetical protein
VTTPSNPKRERRHGRGSEPVARGLDEEAGRSVAGLLGLRARPLEMLDDLGAELVDLLWRVHGCLPTSALKSLREHSTMARRIGQNTIVGLCGHTHLC